MQSASESASSSSALPWSINRNPGFKYCPNFESAPHFVETCRQSPPSPYFTPHSDPMETSKFQRLTVSEPFLRLGSLLAEGPFYRPEDDTLHFVDIRGKLLYSVPLSGATPPRALSTEDVLGVACLIEGDNENYIVAGKRGFALLNQTTGELKYLAKVFPDAAQEKRYPSLQNCSN